MTTTRTSNKDAVQLIQDRIAFTGSNFYGVVTPPDFNKYEPIVGMLPEEFIDILEDAEYIVYSYQTPIFWFANGAWHYPKVKYSHSTTRHQSIVQKVQ